MKERRADSRPKTKQRRTKGPSVPSFREKHAGESTGVESTGVKSTGVKGAGQEGAGQASAG